MHARPAGIRRAGRCFTSSGGEGTGRARLENARNVPSPPPPLLGVSYARDIHAVFSVIGVEGDECHPSHVCWQWDRLGGPSAQHGCGDQSALR